MFPVRLIRSAFVIPIHYSIEYLDLFVISRFRSKSRPDFHLVLLGHSLLNPVEIAVWPKVGEISAMHHARQVVVRVVEHVALMFQD